MLKLSINVNGVRREAEMEDRTLLVTALRNHFGLTGTHIGCDTAQCGACTVRLNGHAIKSCSILAAQANGGEIQTIESLASENEPLHPMQQAFNECFALQCGYCTPGMIMTAVDLVEERPGISRKEIAASIGGNLCRCTGYDSILDAIELGGKYLQQQREES